MAENTPWDNLVRLVERGVLRTTEHDVATVYAPEPLYSRFQALRGVLGTNDGNELTSRKADLQEQIETWQETFEVESPDALRDRATESATASNT